MMLRFTLSSCFLVHPRAFYVLVHIEMGPSWQLQPYKTYIHTGAGCQCTGSEQCRIISYSFGEVATTDSPLAS